MPFRIGWLSPFTASSGVGTFSHAVTRAFPRSYQGQAIDLTVLHPAHAKLYRSPIRCIQIEDTPTFHRVMPLFDLLIYNIGNNSEHHEVIFKLLSMYPGIVICHDYVFQHYLVRRSMGACNNFSSYGALLTKYGDAAVPGYIKRSRVTSRIGGILYGPWDGEHSVSQPLSEILQGLGSALVLHSAFAGRRAKASFAGPVIELGMPYDQKRVADVDDIAQWGLSLASKRVFRLVSFGHIQKTKCIDQILGAIAASKILRQRIRYTIAGFAGDKEYFSELQNIIGTLSLRDIVTFEVDISERRLDHLMHEADIFINLRRPNTEGSSASLVEQLEAGKPVIVLDSGSYGEIPANAAVKLPADAGVNDIRNSLERLIGKPESLRAIGKAGQAYARSWSCASYCDGLLRFIFKNHDLLQGRARITSVQPAPAAGKFNDPIFANHLSDDRLWQASLARARRSLRYLDTNMIALDPDIILGMRVETLCTYVAQVIFGIFNRPGLHQALTQFFLRRKKQRAYWDCIVFTLIADAVFDEHEAARQRLLEMPACFDLELWAVIEQLPPDQFLAAAHLLLRLQPPEREHLTADHDIPDSRMNRLRILERLEDCSEPTSDDAEALKNWLAAPSGDGLEPALPMIEKNLSVVVGGTGFRHSAAIWGFHKMEADHAWMRGRRGVIALRLAPNVTRIALLVRHVDASADMPCTVGLSDGTSQTEIEVHDMEPHWIAIETTPDAAHDNSLSRLRITASRASRAPNSLDARILGCCVLRLEVNVRLAQQRVDSERVLLGSNV